MRAARWSVQGLRLNGLSAFTRAVLGGLMWLATFVWFHPLPGATEWAIVLLLLSPLVLVPLGMRLEERRGEPMIIRSCWRAASGCQLPAALLLVAAFTCPEGLPAAVLCLPWLATTSMLGLIGLGRMVRRGMAPVDQLSMDAALLFLPIGAGWAVLSRWGARPLHFEPVIVLLTAVHFHHAGFVLPLLTGLAARATGGKAGSAASVGVVAGVPLVAAGIMATQFGYGPLLEVAAAGLTTIAALLTAWLHLQMAGDHRWPGLVRRLWLVAGLALTGSMILAGMYGFRTYVPLPWLDIPWMRAWHGTGNALGFGLAGMIGWSLVTFFNPDQRLSDRFPVPFPFHVGNGSHPG